MPKQGDVKVEVYRHENGIWEFKNSHTVESSGLAPSIPVDNEWEDYPEGAIYVKGNQLMKDGQPHTIQCYFNEMKWPTIVDNRNQLRKLADLNYLDEWIEEALDLGFNAIGPIIMGQTWFPSHDHYPPTTRNARLSQN